MSVVHKCLNGRSLVILRKSEVRQALTINNISPTVALLTAWTKESVGSEQLLIKILLQSGCKYFVCAGRYAEDLHDFIDQLIEDVEGQSIRIMTTYHDDESVDSVVNFFINVTNVANQDSDGLVAILNDDLFGDAIFKKKLLEY